MKDLSTIDQRIKNRAQSRSDPFAQTVASTLTVEQKQAIKYFYERLSRIYNAEYRRQLPDESTERASKAEFGCLVMNISKENMDTGLNALHENLAQHDSDYRFMPMDMIIELVKNGGNASGAPAGIYKIHKPRQLEDLTTKQKRKDIGKQKCKSLKSLFD